MNSPAPRMVWNWRLTVAVLIGAALWVVIVFAVVTVAAADSRPVRPGDSGAQVEDIQQQLAAYGYTVTVDGRFGPQTTKAVRHWQQANGLVVDGIVGPVTRASLDLSPATPAQPARRLNPPTLSPEETIRAVWPDDVEDRAVAIAWRESRLTPSARNACCYGLFQIHFAAHRSWLGQFGVTSPADLLNADTNARVALALYQSAGWGPWSL